MNRNAVSNLIRNEIKQYNRDKRCLISTYGGSALILLAILLLMAFPLKLVGEVNPDVLEAVKQGNADDDGKLPALVAVSRTVIAALLVFPAMFSPGFLALSTMTSEKEKRTLECLLALPVSDADIFVSKTLSTIPFALVGTWSVYLVSAIVAALLYSSRFASVLLGGRFLFEVFVLVPLLALLSALGGVIVSINTPDTKTAQSLAFIPQIILVSVSMLLAMGTISLSWDFLLVAVVVLAILDLIASGMAMATFRREHLLLRY